MDKKASTRLQRIFMMLAALALCVSALSCSSKQPRVKRTDPSNGSVVEEDSKDVVVIQNNQTTNSAAPTTKGSTQRNPSTSANPFEGTWDVDINGSFANWTFGYASKSQSGDKLEGKITDGGSAVIGDYVVLPNGTVELNIYASGIGIIVPYRISNSGNKIEINDGTTKVFLTKGKTNTTIQNDGNVLASKGWSNVTNSSDIINFTSVNQSSAGWTGAYARGSDYGTFSMTAGKITLNSQFNGSVNSFKYTIRNSNILDLTDSRGNTETFN